MSETIQKWAVLRMGERVHLIFGDAHDNPVHVFAMNNADAVEMGNELMIAGGRDARVIVEPEVPHDPEQEPDAEGD